MDGTTLGAATDIDGIYLLQGITPGDSVKITVVYLGYEPVTKPVRIVAGETATLNFQLIGSGQQHRRRGHFGRRRWSAARPEPAA